MCCPADINTNSAALRYILRESGIDNIFQLRPKVGEVLTIPASSFLDNQIVNLLITRPSQRAPQITDDFFLCLEHLKASLLSYETPDIHFPERPSAAWTTSIMVSWTFLQELVSQLFYMIASMSLLPALDSFLVSPNFDVHSFCLFLFSVPDISCLIRPSGSTRATGCYISIPNYTPLLFKEGGGCQRHLILLYLLLVIAVFLSKRVLND